MKNCAQPMRLIRLFLSVMLTTSLLAGCQSSAGPAPTPSTQDAGLYAWYRADAGAESIPHNDEQLVYRWADRSGHRRDLGIDPLGTARWPSLIDDAVNGEPAIRLGGQACLISTPDIFGSLDGPKTVFVVAQVRDAARGFVYDSADESGRNTLHTGNGIDRGTWDVNSGAVHGTTIGPAVLNDTWQTHTVIYDEAQNRHAINGRQVSSGDFIVHPLTGLTLGCRYNQILFIDADIAELIIYRGVLNKAHRQSIEAYLMRRYQIDASPPH